MSVVRKLLAPGLIGAVVLALCLSTGSFAAGMVTGKQIAKNAVTSKHVKNGSLKAADLSASARASLKGARGAAGATGAAGEDGEPGTPGATGPQGETGPRGLQGTTGATGPQGVQGPQGPQGPHGVLGLVKVEVNDTVGGNAEKTTWVSCPAGKVLLDWALSPSANIDDLAVVPKYIYNTFGLPDEVGVRVSNFNIGVNGYTLVALCATQS